MFRNYAVIVVLGTIWLILSGCGGSSHPAVNPIQPVPSVQNSANPTIKNSNTHLWGIYDICFDPASGELEIIRNRQAEFTGNVTKFVNGNPTNLGFKILETIPGTDYIDVDIDVSIKHPFPGLPQYNGYDVRGVFMGEGSAVLASTGVSYPEAGVDQMMLADPDDGVGGPDGYTRWFNQGEFSEGGMPLFNYTQGALATPGYDKTATLNPYKYFANDLQSDESAWDWLESYPESNGQFTSGATNTRNYYIRFPNTIGVKFGYAVIANWEGIEPEYHPSNAVEAVLCDVDDSSTVYYENETNNGGNIILDLSLWGWHGQPSAITLESTVLQNPYQLSPSEMVPVGGNENYSTWHVDVAADNITGVDRNEYWIIAEYDDDYSNDFGVTNLADGPLAAYFRYDLEVSPEGQADITLLTPNGGEVVEPGGDFEITWTSDSLSTVDLEYSKDDFVSDIQPIASDEPNDGSYIWQIPCDPSDTVKMRAILSDFPSVYDVSDDYFTIDGGGWAQNWGDNPDYTYCGASGVAFDGDGNVYVAGKYNGTTDFDPGPDVENYDSNGWYDVYLSSYTICGTYNWTITFGGTLTDSCRAVSVDADGNVYLAGYFDSTVDFDPDPVDEEYRTSTGSGDVFLVKFDPTGDFIWVLTFGGSMFDFAYDLKCDGSGNIYLTGWFYGSANFDGTGGSDVKYSNGGYDCFLSKYDTSGNYVWTETWGGSGTDWGSGVDVDSSGNIYCTGWFTDTVDFDPGPGTEEYTTTASPGLYVTKFDPSGVHDWARTWGGSTMSNWDFSPDIAVRDSDIAVTARFLGTVDFDPGPGEVLYTSNGGVDPSVSKFNTDGEFQWARIWGSGEDEFGRGAAIDSFGNIYVSGEFRGTVDFDPDPVDTDLHVCNGYLDLSLSKFDSTGDFLWARTWGDFGADRPGLVEVDQYDNPYMVGYFRGPGVEFAPVNSPCFSESDIHDADGETDSFVVKYMQDGCW